MDQLDKLRLDWMGMVEAALREMVAGNRSATLVAITGAEALHGIIENEMQYRASRQNPPQQP